MSRRASAQLGWLFAGASLLAFGAGAGPEDDLPRYYRDWLRDVAEPIITPAERREYLALADDAQRDRFIAEFWRRRDPIPESPSNEYQEAYERRLLEADRKYGGETPRRGRHTDRGRIYVVLGPPTDITATPSSADFYPHEIWHYDRVEEPGLPPSLNLMFFKRKGVGEYRLYSPAFDGPRELTPIQRLKAELDGIRYRRDIGRGRIPWLDFELQEAMAGVSPGYNSMASEEILFRLRQAPLQRQDRFGPERDTKVETRYTFSDPFSMRGQALMTYGRDAEAQVDLVVEVPPEALTAREEDERTYLRLDLTGRIETPAGAILKTIDDIATYEFSPTEFAGARAFPLRYAARAFLLPGRYAFDLLVRNFTDGAIGRFRLEFEVEARAAGLGLSPPIFGGLPRTIDASPGPYQPEPLRCDRLRLAPEADGAFAAGQPLLAYFEISDPQPAKGYSLRYVLRRGHEDVWRGGDQLTAPQPGLRGAIPVLRPLDTALLSTGRYRLEVEIEATDGRRATTGGDFEVGGDPPPAGVLETVSQAVDSPAQFHLELAQQHLLAGDLERARFHADSALAFAPEDSAAGLLLAKLEVRSGRLDQGIARLESMVATDPDNSEALAALAYGLSQRGELGASAERYRLAIAKNPVSAPPLWNALAEVLARAGDRDGARAAFRRSLELNPDQAEVQEALTRLDAPG